MSMTPEEQKELAIECGAVMNGEHHIVCLKDNSIAFSFDELTAYTTAVEAKEREKVIACIAKNSIFTDDLFMLNQLIREMK